MNNTGTSKISEKKKRKSTSNKKPKESVNYHTFVHEFGFNVRVGTLPLYSWVSKYKGPAKNSNWEALIVLLSESWRTKKKKKENTFHAANDGVHLVIGPQFRK